MEPIDFANATYIRVYTRSPASLEMAGYEAESLFFAIQRHLDQSGVLAFGNVDLVRLICRRTGAPQETVEKWLPVLLEIGALVLRSGTLIDPTFVASQTTSKSNKQRQREFRDRHRDEALSQPPPATLELFEQSSNETLQKVTQNAVREEKVLGSEVSVSSSSEDPRSLPDTTHAREAAANDAPPAASNVVSLPPRQRQPDGSYDSKHLAKDFGAIRKANGGGTFTQRHTDYQPLQDALAWAFAHFPADPRAACIESITNFVRNGAEWERRRGWALKDWAADPGRWHAQTSPLRMGGAPRKAGPAPVATDDEYAQAKAIGGSTWDF
jgi:hypothetical protein